MIVKKHPVKTMNDLCLRGVNDLKTDKLFKT